MANDFSGGIVHLKHILHASDGAHPVNYVEFVGYQRAFKYPGVPQACVNMSLMHTPVEGTLDCMTEGTVARHKDLQIFNLATIR
jgi:hypothetical protein